MSWVETEEYAVSDDYVENRGDARRAEVGSRERGDEETRGGRGISSGCRAARCRAHPRPPTMTATRSPLAASTRSGASSEAGIGKLFERRRAVVGRWEPRGGERARARSSPRRASRRHRCRGHRQEVARRLWTRSSTLRTQNLSRGVDHESDVSQRRSLPEHFTNLFQRHRRFSREFFQMKYAYAPIATRLDDFASRVRQSQSTLRRP